MIKRQPLVDFGYPYPRKEPPMMDASRFGWTLYRYACEIRDTRGKGTKARASEEYVLGTIPFRFLERRRVRVNGKLQPVKEKVYKYYKRGLGPSIIDFPTLGVFMRQVHYNGRSKYRWSRTPSDEDLALLKLSLPHQYVKYLAS